MPNIYLIVGYDWEYNDIRVAYKSKEMAETIIKTLNESNDQYVYVVKEIILIEENV